LNSVRKYVAAQHESDRIEAARTWDRAKGDTDEATERLQYKSPRRACREKLNARISHLRRAIDRVE